MDCYDIKEINSVKELLDKYNLNTSLINDLIIELGISDLEYRLVLDNFREDSIEGFTEEELAYELFNIIHESNNNSDLYVKLEHLGFLSGNTNYMTHSYMFGSYSNDGVANTI